MDIRQNPLWLSIPVGTYFKTDVRVSILFPLLAILFCANLGLQLGLLVTGLLFVALIFHEFGHIFAARQTGGAGHEILVWPLGGLASVTPAPNFYSEFWTVAGGPLTNLIICLCCLPAMISSPQLWECFSLLTIPTVNLQTNLSQALLLLTFSVNFKLLVLNLLPIYPLDGGQMAYHIAKLSWERQTAKTGTLWAGMVLCILLTLAGALLKSIDLILLASFLMMLGMHEHFAAQISRTLDDSFMGYDFSQGYTSLEGQTDREPRQPGFIERWRRDRARKKQEKAHQQRIETEQKVDELLDKVHQSGMNSLTDAERRFLQRASDRYRSHGKE